MTTANVHNILSPQETALLRSVAQVGAQRATQLVAFYESIFTEVSAHSVSERTKDKAAKQLLSAFPTLGQKRGPKKNPNSVMARVHTSVNAAMFAGHSTSKDIFAYVQKEHADIPMEKIKSNAYFAPFIKRSNGHWTRA